MKTIVYLSRFLCSLLFFFSAICLVQSSIGSADEKWDTILSGIKRQVGEYHIIRSLKEHIPDGGVDAGELVEHIQNGFDTIPPGEGGKRDILFFALDVAAVASEERKFKPLYELKKESMRKVFQSLQQASRPGDLVIYKLYNEGVIIRAPGVCFGIDILLDPENDDLAPDLAQILDGLLITHPHGDHYDRISRLIPELERAGKPVILPEDNKDVPFGSLLTEGTLGSLQWSAFRGGHVHLGFSSFYCLKISNKWKVLHSGDNTLWLAFSKSEYAKDVDIFFLKPEALYLKEENTKGYFKEGGWGEILQIYQAAMEEILLNIRPKIIIPHHLLELGHGLNAYGHDMGFRLRRQAPAGVKVTMLHWGESLTLK